MSTHVWWYVARASGITAWALATASVLWGLALSTRALGPKPRAPWLLDLHRFLGALTLVFTAVHVGGLVADSTVHFGPAEILVPLASGWQPLAVAAGIVATYLLVAIELTSLVMRWLPKRLWHAVHLTSFGLFALATGHMLTAGTDASNRVLLIAAWSSVVAVVFLTAYRVLVPKSARSAAARSRAAEARPISARPVADRAAPAVAARPAAGDRAAMLAAARAARAEQATRV